MKLYRPHTNEAAASHTNSAAVGVIAELIDPAKLTTLARGIQQDKIGARQRSPAKNFDLLACSLIRHPDPARIF